MKIAVEGLCFYAIIFLSCLKVLVVYLCLCLCLCLRFVFVLVIVEEQEEEGVNSALGDSSALLAASSHC